MAQHQNFASFLSRLLRRQFWSNPALVLLLLSGIGCSKKETPLPSPTTTSTGAEQSWVEDITEKTGLSFVHDAGALGTYFMPESLGSGAAIFDFDGDERMDVFLLQNAGT